MTCVQTQTVVPFPVDTMAGLNPLRRSRNKAKAAASAFSLANGSNFAHGIPDFSFRHQTVPIQGQNSGFLWTGEGPQYLHQDPAAHAHNGFESFSVPQESQTGLGHDGSPVIGSTQPHWDERLASAQFESKDMQPLQSQDSNIAHSQRVVAQSSTGSIYDETPSSRTYPNTQVPFHMSSARSDITARSLSPEVLSPTQQSDLFEYPVLGNDTGVPVFHRTSSSGMESQSMNVSLSGPSFNAYATAGEGPYSLTIGPNAMASQDPATADSMYKSGSIDSSMLWDTAAVEFLDSQRSSPVVPEDSWTVDVMPMQPMLMSSTNSPLTYSPSIESLSPRVTRKPMGPRQSKVASDLAANSRQQRLLGSDVTDDSYRLVGRSALEIDNTARDHPLYHNVSAGPDGLYHCPWEGQPSCQHKAEKLKCNYDKFVDSHLKPYRCKVQSCENLHFSSTACLLRHEREAHAMHGHGDKPFLCTYEGCERGVPGNGFPRHWNLRDHMKRVHNDPGPAKSNASGNSPPPSGSVRGKKRKVDDKQDPASVTNERTAKRVATAPVVQTPQKPSLAEQYEMEVQRGSNIWEQLRDPKVAGDLNLFQKMYDCMKVMAQTSKRINDAPSTQPSG